MHYMGSTADEMTRGTTKQLKDKQWNSPNQSSKKKKEWKKKMEDSLRDLWDNIKWFQIHIIGLPGEDRKGQKFYSDFIEESK